MENEKVKRIADDADMIIRGYAFKRDGDFIRVFNINDGESAMMMTPEGVMLETNMDDIQQVIVKRIWEQDSQYMEGADAKVL
ncbi:MAG: hypothetical protein K6F53_04480 [Lachnospiraceae bacterium]|nr:hypothetical protein [Lachnospiraceae bacterium]